MTACKGAHSRIQQQTLLKHRMGCGDCEVCLDSKSKLTARQTFTWNTPAAIPLLTWQLHSWQHQITLHCKEQLASCIYRLAKEDHSIKFSCCHHFDKGSFSLSSHTIVQAPAHPIMLSFMQEPTLHVCLHSHVV